MARIEERTGRLVEHLAGRHDQKTHGRGGVHHTTADGAIKSLAAGQSVTIDRSMVGAVLDRAAKRSDNPDLTELRVAGTLKFGGDGLGIARKDMPQLPADKLPAYIADLKSRGVASKRVSRNPQDLKPIQKEVSASASGRILGSMREDGVSGEIVITKDNYVLDGHHRWGAATALSFERTGVKIGAVQIDMDAEKLLKDANRWTEEQGIARRALGEARVEEHYPHHTGTPQSVHSGKGVPAGYKDRAGFGTKDADGPDVEGRLVMWPNGERVSLDTPNPELVATLARFNPDERATLLAVADKTRVPKSLDEVPWTHSEHFRISHADAIDELSAMATYRSIWKDVPGEMEKMLHAGGGVLAYVYPKGMLDKVRALDASVFDALAEATVEEAEDFLMEHLAGKHDQKSHGRKGGVRPITRADETDAVVKWQATFSGTDFIQENPDSHVAKAFESAVMGAPLVQGVVYRGFRDREAMTAQQSLEKWSKQRGKDVYFDEFKSTSPDLDVARNFGTTIFEIYGAKAHDISGMSVIPDFKEAVMEPGRFRVASARPAATDHPIFGDLIQFGDATIVTLMSTDMVP